MKKPIIILLAVAILGGLGLYSRNQTSASLQLNPSGSNMGSSPMGASSQMGSVNGSNSSAMPASYKNGTYTGATADTAYGPVQIAVVVSGGKITGINFLQMPSDFARSQMITKAVEPMLKQTTLRVQSSNIDFVSGATNTTYGYQQSLQSALDQAAGSALNTATHSSA